MSFRIPAYQCYLVCTLIGTNLLKRFESRAQYPYDGLTLRKLRIVIVKYVA